VREKAELTGWIDVRPARIGLALRPMPDTLLTAADCAVRAWGGVYFPMLRSDDAEAALRFARQLDLDAIYPIDEDGESVKLARETGFVWQGRGDWGPFHEGDSRFGKQLQDTHWVLGDLGTDAELLSVAWAEDDPLAALFKMWFGTLRESGGEPELAEQFLARASHVTLSTGEPLPDMAKCVTPMELTRHEIVYTGEGERSCVVLIDPQNAGDLIRFWNFRAAGGDPFPWPVGYDARARRSFEAWAQDRLANGAFGGWMRGDGTPLGPRAAVYVHDRSETMPDAVTDVLQAAGVEPYVGHGNASAHGWIGGHPFRTEVQRTFSVTIGRHGAFDVPLPQLTGGRWHRRFPSGVVAADINISSASDLPPDWTVAVPAARSVAKTFEAHHDVMVAFERPTMNGRAIGVRADADSVKLAPVRSLSVFEELFGSSHRLRQDEGAKLTTQLMAVLGGPASYAANQPAVREVLLKCAGSHAGRPKNALVQAAKDRIGRWQDRPFGPAKTVDYPEDVVKWLLSKNIIQPRLPVSCPRCSSSVPHRPEDLRAEMKCELCGNTFPLGLALANRTSRTDWLYRLAGNIPREKLVETLPVMAVLSILCSYRYNSYDSPYAVGLQVKGPDVECEVDVAIAVWESHPPLVVLAEVKSHKKVDSNDVENLTKLQKHLRSRGIECFILFATLQQRFSDDEVNAIKAGAIEAPATLGHRIDPVLPIVLARRQLSAPLHHDDHPMKWSEPGRSLVTVAVESCKANIGLVKVELSRQDHGPWETEWGPVPDSRISGVTTVIQPDQS